MVVLAQTHKVITDRDVELEGQSLVDNGSRSRRVWWSTTHLIRNGCFDHRLKAAADCSRSSIWVVAAPESSVPSPTSIRKLWSVHESCLASCWKVRNTPCFIERSRCEEHVNLRLAVVGEQINVLWTRRNLSLIPPPGCQKTRRRRRRRRKCQNCKVTRLNLEVSRECHDSVRVLDGSDFAGRCIVSNMN